MMPSNNHIMLQVLTSSYKKYLFHLFLSLLCAMYKNMTPHDGHDSAPS